MSTEVSSGRPGLLLVLHLAAAAPLSQRHRLVLRSSFLAEKDSCIIQLFKMDQQQLIPEVLAPGRASLWASHLLIHADLKRSFLYLSNVRFQFCYTDSSRNAYSCWRTASQCLLNISFHHIGKVGFRPARSYLAVHLLGLCLSLIRLGLCVQKEIAVDC